MSDGWMDNHSVVPPHEGTTFTCTGMETLSQAEGNKPDMEGQVLRGPKLCNPQRQRGAAGAGRGRGVGG